MSKKSKKKTILIICGIAAAVIIVALLVIFVFSKYIIVDECASSCPRGEVCPAVCTQITLWDVIFRGR